MAKKTFVPERLRRQVQERAQGGVNTVSSMKQICIIHTNQTT